LLNVYSTDLSTTPTTIMGVHIFGALILSVSVTLTFLLVLDNVAADVDFGPWPKYGGRRLVQLLDGTWEMSQLGSIDHPPPTSFDSMDPNLKPSDPIFATLKKTHVKCQHSILRRQYTTRILGIPRRLCV
jgi:hypothetical protein